MKWQTIKLVLLSAVGGAMVWWIVLGAVFGWMPAGSAERQAEDRAQAAFRDALTPICVAQFNADAEKEAKHKLLKEKNTWGHSDFIQQQAGRRCPAASIPKPGLRPSAQNRFWPPRACKNSLAGCGGEDGR